MEVAAGGISRRLRGLTGFAVESRRPYECHGRGKGSRLKALLQKIGVQVDGAALNVGGRRVNNIARAALTGDRHADAGH